MDNKKKITLGISLVLITLLITIGISYAYFSANISGGEDSTTITVTGGEMNIHYSGEADINSNAIVPDNEAFATKTFTVTGNNTMDIEMYYEVSLVVEENTFSEDALKYKLLGTNTDSNGFLIDDITELTSIGTGAKTISLGVGGFDVPTGGNKIHTYSLELYFPETTENQNIDQGKNFKAHVEIMNGAEPERNLYNSILGQGGGTAAITEKGSPDFTQLAPAIITYKELTSTYTNSLSSSADKAIGTGYTFNEKTGNYSLTNYQTSQTYGQEHIGKYTCNYTAYSNCANMYLINEVTGTKVTNSTRYQKEANELDLSDTGLYAEEDEYGVSYYYRGNKDTLKNNLIWGGYQWKIVRINGDKSIRIIYNGTEDQFNINRIMNSTGANTQIGISSWNTNRYDAKYVGYMYGGANGVASTMRNGSTSAAATFNETDTNIKTTLDNWFKTNIVNKGYSDMVVDNLFCNDRQTVIEGGNIQKEPGPGYGSEGINTIYAFSHRTTEPTLKCGLQNDRFTVSDITLGNGSLTYPIGLLTADESSLGGLKSGTYDRPKNTNYLHTDSTFWLFTPQSMNLDFGERALVMFIDSAYGLYSNVSYTVDSIYGVRPVLSLSSSTMVAGTGSSTDPFVVK